MSITPMAIPRMASDVLPFLLFRFLMLKVKVFNLREIPIWLTKGLRERGKGLAYESYGIAISTRKRFTI